MKKNVGLKRDTADRLIKELVERVKIGNSLPKEEVPHLITRLFVFGSYLTDKKKLGDIDIFFEQESKWDDFIKEMECFANQVTIRCMEDEYSASYRATRRFIRNKKKSYSFHPIYELEHFLSEDDSFQHKEIFNINGKR
jgi:predicted nucleotidyltransferase